MAVDVSGKKGGWSGKGAVVVIGLVLALIAVWVVAAAGITSVTVEPGHVGYVYSKPLILSGGRFLETLPGPARWGLCWRKYAQSVDVRQFTMDEHFEVLAKDDLMIRFNAHAMLSAKSDPLSVREVVEKYWGGKWYEEFFKERFRARVYDAVREHDSRSAKEKRADISKEVLEAMRAACKETPFVVHDVVIGNITYPKMVQDAVEQKLASQQELERSAVQVEIAKRQALVKIEEARGVAQAQEIINNTLTTNYIRHEYVNALMSCARSPNTTIIYVPLGADGLPFVLDPQPKAPGGGQPVSVPKEKP
ncbi:MAG TPA: SPFH domain-containing protein [Planctomycetota bacterium]|nr:SPFH domain-containing protein [Planctomycetota bacterium]